jgi:hypothetical protein
MVRVALLVILLLFVKAIVSVAVAVAVAVVVAADIVQSCFSHALLICVVGLLFGCLRSIVLLA